MRHLGQPGSGGDPIIIGLEGKPEPVVKDPQITLVIARDGIRPYGAHFLRYDTNIGLFTAVIRKAVIAESIVEPADQHDIMLQPDVRAPPATTSPATASTVETTAATTSAAERSSPMSATGEPRRSPSPVMDARSGAATGS